MTIFTFGLVHACARGVAAGIVGSDRPLRRLLLRRLQLLTRTRFRARPVILGRAFGRKSGRGSTPGSGLGRQQLRGGRLDPPLVDVVSAHGFAVGHVRLAEWGALLAAGGVHRATRSEEAVPQLLLERYEEAWPQSIPIGPDAGGGPVLSKCFEECRSHAWRPRQVGGGCYIHLFPETVSV